jgi:hypothetical protein
MSKLPVLATMAETCNGLLGLGRGRLLVTEVMAISKKPIFVTKASGKKGRELLKSGWRGFAVGKLVEVVTPVI